MAGAAAHTPEDMHALIHQLAENAKRAYLRLSTARNEAKDMALVGAAMSLREQMPTIIAANNEDVATAKQAGLSDAMLDRLILNEDRIEAMAQGLETIATLPDPVNKIMDEWERPNGLILQRVSIPLGIIGIIYESRPNVTADAAGLCIKSGNACILRGGSESLNSSKAIAACMQEGLKSGDIPAEAVQIVPTTNREAVGAMLSAHGLIDVIIPRGGKGLTARVQQDSRIPTLLHLDGNCHIYIHEEASVSMATEVVVNAKMRRTGICGATESLVIDEAIAGTAVPKLVNALSQSGCEIRGDAASQHIDKRIVKATDDDWETEYLAPIISIKIVKGIGEAVAHINQYGSHHTDAIITDNKSVARKFLREVDSAIVLHNASTQYADGGEFGFGAEIGISTGRLHARGPVGAEQLTTYKYVVHGNGQVRP